MNSKRQASKIKHLCGGLSEQAATQAEEHKGCCKESEGEKAIKNQTLSTNIVLCHLVEKYLPAGQGSLC